MGTEASRKTSGLHQECDDKVMATFLRSGPSLHGNRGQTGGFPIILPETVAEFEPRSSDVRKTFRLFRVCRCFANHMGRKERHV